jgi:hypothetical protein
MASNLNGFFETTYATESGLDLGNRKAYNNFVGKTKGKRSL